MMDKKFNEAVGALPERISEVLKSLPQEVKAKCFEVSLRINKPISIKTATGIYFPSVKGIAERIPTTYSFICGKAEIDDALLTLTDYSRHSFVDKINKGYITVRGGHRVGVCGTSTYHKDTLLVVSDVSYLNLRIAREVKGCGKTLATDIFTDGLHSTLIVGSPSSGKTTLLRDIAYWLSSGECGMLYKVSMIDERGELAAVCQGEPRNETGVLTDVLDGYKKSEGMRVAIRSMSPQVIVVDEIGGEDDAKAIKECINSGVAVIATIHAGSVDELYKKEFLQTLLHSDFERIVFLKNMVVEEVRMC